MPDNKLTLIIDDEADIRELLEMTLGRMDVPTHCAATTQEAKNLLAQHEFGMCLTDMKLPDGDGLEIVKHIQKYYPDLPVAVITAHGNMELAIEALKTGAFDFVSKPVDLNVLRNLVNSGLKLSSQSSNLDRRSRDQLLGDSPAMQKTRATIAKLARSQAPVYISGESGTGKELVARLIHDKGPRANGAFVPVNCGAIPSELMESEFFGHKKGSFTGATTDKQGLFQAADGGTLFLDEVADLPLHMQVKLLRAIQEKSIRPIGASKESSINVRILSATHKPLAKLVDDGKFRQDLFYRLNVIEVNVPPLRERKEDIKGLTSHILERLTKESGMPIPQVEDSAIEALKRYAFPGNVRELENILERSITLCENNVIRAEDLNLRREEIQTSDEQDAGLNESIINNVELETNGNFSLEEQLEKIERTAILKALESAKYNKTAAAKLLGMSFRSLRYRLKKLDLD
ncbi:sigma-54-dependent transcriptional regulator [Kaarinaea lacus]